MGIRSRCGAIALVSLAFAGVALAATPLGYRFPVGGQIELRSTTHIDAPIVGAIDAVVTDQLRTLSADAAGMKTDHAITSRSPGHADYKLALGCTITPVGQVQDVTGIDPNDATQALIAKNLAVGLPALPNAPVAVGSTWATEKPFYLPKVSIPGVPAVIRVRTNYTVTKLETRAGVSTVTLQVVIVQSPGQSTKVKANGTWLLELATGRPIAGAVRGEATIRIALVPTSCPFRLDVSSH